MHTGSIIVLITIFVYLVGMVLIGVYYGKRNSSTSEFYLGGRTLGPYVTAMSAEASDMSSYLLMGIPGLAYLSGMAHAGWTIAGLAIGTYFNWLFTAQRLRRYTHITDSFTFPQFLSHRFHEEKNVLAAIGAVVIVIFFVPYTASGFAACGKVFSTLLGLDYTVTMVVSAIVIVSYIAIGGFLAVSMTDFIQSIIMSVAIFFVVGFAVVNAGGVDIILDNARALRGICRRRFPTIQRRTARRVLACFRSSRRSPGGWAISGCRTFSCALWPSRMSRSSRFPAASALAGSFSQWRWLSASVSLATR